MVSLDSEFEADYLSENPHQSHAGDLCKTPKTKVKRSKWREKATTQLNIILFGWFFFLFDRNNKGCIREDIELEGQHNSRSFQGQKVKIKRKLAIARPNFAWSVWFWVMAVLHWFWPLALKLTQGHFKVKIKENYRNMHYQNKTTFGWIVAISIHFALSEWFRVISVLCWSWPLTLKLTQGHFEVKRSKSRENDHNTESPK